MRRIQHEELDSVQGVRLSSVESGTKFGTKFCRGGKGARSTPSGGTPGLDGLGFPIARAPGWSWFEIAGILRRLIPEAVVVGVAVLLLALDGLSSSSGAEP